jgi:hypothetical protein
MMSDIWDRCDELREANEHLQQVNDQLRVANNSLRAELAAERERHTDLALAHGRIVQDRDAALTRLAQMEDALAKARGALSYLSAWDADQSLAKENALAAIDAVLAETK